MNLEYVIELNCLLCNSPSPLYRCPHSFKMVCKKLSYPFKECFVLLPNQRGISQFTPFVLPLANIVRFGPLHIAFLTRNGSPLQPMWDLTIHPRCASASKYCPLRPWPLTYRRQRF